MKKELWMGYTGMLKGYNASSEDTFLGYIEVEVPKKTVTKEFTCVAWHANGALGNIPPNAKNVRILFDVEE